jgi:hypothetical protein
VAIAANLATTILQSSATRLEDTRTGKVLKSAGLLKPNLYDRLRSALTRSIRSLTDDHPQYRLQGVRAFLASDSVAASIRQYLLEGTPPDREHLKLHLADCLDVPRGTPAKAWPNRISPDELLDQLLDALHSSLTRDSDPGLLLIKTEIGLLTSQLEQTSDDIAGLRDHISYLFDQSALKNQKRRFKEFEDQFIAHIRQRCERLTTPGARELHGLKQSLTIAYISLNTKTTGGAEPIKAEELVVDNNLLIIRGPAGSGKTTLLNWIALNCGKGREQPNQWSGGVPFIMPLRTVARLEAGAPRVENFVRYSVDEQIWSEHPPDGWLNGVLHSQRGIVMIDGVDELPAPRRVAFWEWLDEFIAAFPGNRVVVTSRTLPGSMTSDTDNRNEQWSPPREFLDAELEPMSLADIREFIYHWHDAVDSSKLDRFEVADLSRARKELPGKLEDPANRRIRELCGTPLLCAVVCVLNWREEGYLPRRRVELYARCCDMLVEERDLKRGLPKPLGALSYVTKNDKELVLQRIAFNMMHSRPDGDEVDAASYRMEIPRSKAVQWIGGCIASFHDSQARDCDLE